MGLYDEFLNLKHVDIEDTIRRGICDTLKKLDGLSKERTCFIFCSYLYEFFKKEHLLVQLIDSSADFNMDYQHYFLIVPVSEHERYVIDLTFQQFGVFSDSFSISRDGYQLMDDDIYSEYLNCIRKVSKNRVL